MRRYLRHYNGVVHSVNAEDFTRHLAQARSIQYQDKTVEVAREATPDEVAAYWARQGFAYDPATDEACKPVAAPVAAPESKGKAAKAE